MSEAIYVGWEPREAQAFMVAVHSIRKHLSRPIPVRGLVLDELIASGLHRRPMNKTVNSDGHVKMIDVLSIRADYNGAISTEFANTRFFVPHLAKTGWAVFMDCDMLVRGDMAALFDQLDPKFAVYCVQHDYKTQHATKMDGQANAAYAKKNWSSVTAFNCDHPANKSLTLDALNTLPGRDLHRFCWLDDSEIGELSPTWNWLAGESEPLDNPKVVHHTLGAPCMPGYENAPFADEWRTMLNQAAAAALSFGG